MTNEKDLAVADIKLGDHWLEDVEAELPEEIASGKGHVKLPDAAQKKTIRLGVRQWPDGHEAHLKAALTDTIGQVFAQAADVLREPLLPPRPQVPLDSLRYLKKNREWSDPVMNLEQPLWLALAHGVTRHFGIEYKLVIKINTRWGLAPSPGTTPRELLTSFGMNPQEFSLYTIEGVDPLPPDTPLSVRRGDRFEAQKDGKYGSTISLSRPLRSSQTIEDDVDAASETGINARLIAVSGQKYVEVRQIAVPSRPWGKTEANILIAIPATYPSGGLDAFYLELPFTHSSGSIPCQQQTMVIDERNWALISWHYHPSRPWNPLQDDLTTHIQNCRGFFLTRGVRQ